ncbi:UNKNOWN [Stylonychia lemnae]|uniref:Uncharacterized protein n=1 Tax=Stylonychia lemnae TaxID=5949 RepID=A0A078B6E2_STYLE|nr:UNKNOWN [Stylonychia lemnae]|eukprot:CDW89118.1 UNKNOWN [Stylonychia lemnae]
MSEPHKRSGMDDFLKRKDDNLEELQKKYFESPKEEIKNLSKGQSSTFSEQGELEYYLRKQKEIKSRVPLTQKFKKSLSDLFTVQVGRNSIYVWRSRQQQAKKWRHGVQSLRQQEITKQLDEIAKVIGANEPNQFEPLKNVEFDKSYSGDQFQYQYQLEEKQLQDQLFKLYDELEEEREEEEE